MPELLAHQVAVLLEFTQRTADGVKPVEADSRQAGDRHLPARSVRADVSEHALGPERQPGIAERAVEICVY
ncbi:hypothetical protein ABTZ58_32805 [Streptomyces sp. NPDC094143]|uniref:hypothetical protein n=1 Tax=Streptomyces sp. NPDC094143 TaxID=3155310 RepID=UPI00332E1883